MPLQRLFKSGSSLQKRRFLRIRLDAPTGIWHVVDLPVEGFSCGFSSDSDIDLRHFIASPRGGAFHPDELCFEPSGELEGQEESGGFLGVSSRREILIDGVKGRSGRLPAGSFVRYGELKIRFIGLIEEFEELVADVPWKSAGIYAALLLGIAAGVLLLVFALAGKQEQLVDSEASVQSAKEETAEVSPAPAAVSEESLSGPGHVPKESMQLIPTILLEPEGNSGLPEGCDVLFLHAHPDDESIDFGALIAHAAARNLSIAVLLFTDGEAGIFRVAYPGPSGELSTLRIAEAQRALTILGSAVYLRLGLKNHPYNSISQELSVEEILKIWGGRGALAKRVETIIRSLEPAVIVSPDLPSEAREHFEHEAVGTIVADAVAALRQEGAGFLKAHLICVDPRQRESYPDAVPVPRRDVFSRQREALLSHVTQADASLFGIKMIEEYGNEYYQIKFWELDQSPQSFFLP
ncbi:PIG-L deacetylase family protein [Marispirochaeta sp.]|uniref:PIG-L deacetylase family protein n=1 Tax=Marispirochaeta sp. TaxID=2038653 RepID=UPI003748E925